MKFKIGKKLSKLLINNLELVKKIRARPGQ